MLIAEPSLEDVLTLSTPFNNQGSVIPSPFALGASGGDGFNFNMGGAATGHMWITVSWLAGTGSGHTKPLYRSDQSSITIAAPPGNTSVTPTTGTTAGGALGARTYFVRVGYVKKINGFPIVGLVESGPLTTSHEVSQAVAANNLLTITSPASLAGYDGWIPLIATVSNNEVSQTSNPPGTPIAFGTNYTEPTGGANTTAASGSNWVNTEWAQIAFAELAAATDYYVYPYYDVATGLVLFAIESASITGLAAAIQNADGHYPLTTGGFKITTPAAGGSNSFSPTAGGAGGQNNKLLT